MSCLIRHYPRNTKGRDFAVGDIHGHFSKLAASLDAIGFDPAVDRLFSVGDLVDRGPESPRVVRWLNLDWFNAVRGNHDDYVVRYQTNDTGNWLQNGGAWFQEMDDQEKECFSVLFADLPVAIEVETEQGLVGIVHADCPLPSWDDLREDLVWAGEDRTRSIKVIKNQCMWSRIRMKHADTTPVSGVRAVICGHEPVTRPVLLGNVYHIDTCGWKDNGYFTFLNLNTLECWPLSAEWEL